MSHLSSLDNALRAGSGIPNCMSANPPPTSAARAKSSRNRISDAYNRPAATARLSADTSSARLRGAATRVWRVLRRDQRSVEER